MKAVECPRCGRPALQREISLPSIAGYRTVMPMIECDCVTREQGFVIMDVIPPEDE